MSPGLEIDCTISITVSKKWISKSQNLVFMLFVKFDLIGLLDIITDFSF